MNRLFNIFKYLIGWPLSLVAIFFIVRLVLLKSSEILPFVKSPNFFLFIPAIIILSTYFFIRSYIWKRLLDESGHKFSLKTASYLWATSEFKRFVPGYIWTYVGKTVSFSNLGVDKKTVANLILVEISFFMTGTFIVALLSFNFLSQNFISINIVYKYLIFILTVLGSAFFIFNKVIFDNLKLPAPLRFFKLVLPPFKPYVNFEILTVSVFDHFLFGLGTYLAISSFVYLPVEKMLALTGFFSLSLLAGYLSIVTPMGLGVREGIMTFGLSKIILASTAGLSSIIARLTLIFSEIICLLFLYAWKNIKLKQIDSLEKFTRANLHALILSILILAYSIYFTTVSFLRHDNFFTGKFDLGNMDQAAWNTINGNFFMFTNPDGLNEVSRLAFHADFILILLSPLYLIWSHPKMLLLIQTLILSLGAMFVYLISKDILKNRNLSLVLSGAYLLNPSVQFTNLYDFHPVTLATTFILGAFYFLRKKSYYIFLIFLILACLSKEQIWIVSAFFGISIFLIDKKRLLGGGLFVVSLAVFYLLVSYIIPYFRESQHFALSYYSEFGDSPLNIVKNVLLSPFSVMGAILSESSRNFLLRIFLPLGFLSFASPLYLLFSSPDFAISILSSNPQFRQIYYQYTAVISPFVFISAIFGIKFIRDKYKVSNKLFAYYLLLFALTSAYFHGPLPLASRPSISVFTQQLSYRDEVSKALESIPKDAKVAASNNLGAHLSHRKFLYILPMGVEDSEYIAFLTTDVFAQPSLNAQEELALRLKNDPSYQVLYDFQNFLLLKRLQ